MGRKQTRLVSFISRLQWTIPLIFALFGIGYVLLDQVLHNIAYAKQGKD